MVIAFLIFQEAEVIGRIKASLDDPFGLENAGFCLLDMYAERRGNLFQEEVYRLTKATDATTVKGSESTRSSLPTNHKFSNNDVIVLTQQPRGSGDFFTPQSLPITETAITAEARVLNVGPTYLDVAMTGGAFESALGLAANDFSNKGNRQLRLRVDRFVSNIPYQRMVGAISQLTSVPKAVKDPKELQEKHRKSVVSSIRMDDTLKEMILATFAYADLNSFSYHDVSVCDIEELVRNRSFEIIPIIMCS